ncbi:dnaJ homolog subfamily C member 9-like [Macrosteles quadrilineatus]|uniref:dnaJ homolog subfamily C member 9-like n=1 Tax=Macrosteles quadrilineatus TaxID=74068 RepID=UPI0023E0D811|nr:dnaJ homolog subfamily C member 9-like [Macrosteles quadrilineatus]
MDFGESCISFFNTKDFYEILNIPRTASQREVRKAYHTLSLTYHPDKVEDSEREEATEKFKILGKVFSILNDVEKRSIYDDTGSWSEEGEDFTERDWVEFWRNYFKEVTITDLDKYADEYKGSDEELEDLKKAYEKCKGDFDKMFQYIMFATVEDEERIRGRLMKLIEQDELPSYDIFVNEPQEKRDRRIRRLRKEAKEAEDVVKKAKKEQEFEELTKAILSRKTQTPTMGFLESLEQKFAPKGKKAKKSRSKSKK